MSLYVVSLATVIVSIVLYQIAQRSMPKDINPFYVLIFIYLLGAAFSGVASLFFPADRSVAAFGKTLNWAAPVLAVAIVGLEIGYLLAYRAGWNLALAPILILVPVGFLFFRESLTPVKAVGLLLCIVGFVLASRR
ncbi:MAG: hypothetical protein C4332_09480 [Meiothermus sp.]